MNLFTVLSIGIGGFTGSILRYVLGSLIAKNAPSGFPFATLIINIAGALCIGLLAGYFDNRPMASEHWKSFLTIGLCGGFTTFSAFSAENMQLLRLGQYQLALMYIFSSVLLCLLATFLGSWLARTQM